MMSALVAAAEPLLETLPGGPQPDAVLARQMQALSLAVHIPLVCFGISFPAMVLFMEGPQFMATFGEVFGLAFALDGAVALARRRG